MGEINTRGALDPVVAFAAHFGVPIFCGPVQVFAGPAGVLWQRRSWGRAGIPSALKVSAAADSQTGSAVRSVDGCGVHANGRGCRIICASNDDPLIEPTFHWRADPLIQLSAAGPDQMAVMATACTLTFANHQFSRRAQPRPYLRAGGLSLRERDGS